MPVGKHCFRKPSPTLCLYFPGHLEDSLLSHPSGVYLGRDTLYPPCGEREQDYCDLWPDVWGERSMASSLRALESMGHCHPHGARPGLEGCVVGR